MVKDIKKIILAVATLTGLIIGVGIFALPYIALQVGLWTMVLYLIIITAMVLLVNYMYCDVALKTPDFLRLPGYAKMHLGKVWKTIAVVSAILGSVGTLLVYTIVGGGFLGGLLKPIMGGSDILFPLIYFIVGAMYIYMGSKAISKIEFWGISLFFVALLVVLFQGISFWHFTSLSFNMSNWGSWFLPYGPLLFALWGASMIPELEEMLGDDKKKLHMVITISTLISAGCFIFFILLVLGISGAQTSQEAISGLQGVLGSKVISALFLAGLLATFTSFVAVGLNLKKVLWYDMKLSERLAWILTCSVPFVLFLAGFNNFIGIIGLIGGVSLAVDGILIALMHRRVEYSSSKLLTYSVILIFALGIIYELIYFF